MAITTIKFFSDKIYFIDFEFANINYFAFDIANHFDEFAGVHSIHGIHNTTLKIKTTLVN